MSQGELHIVANCAKRKSARPAAALQFRHFGNEGDDLAERWLDVVASTLPKLSAVDLYRGNHWSVVRQLPALARTRGWSQATLWVASAGLGLIPADTPVAPYSATFAPHDPDSVVRGIPASERKDSTSNWWRALAAARARNIGRPATVASLVERDASASIMVLLSPAYLIALGDDLREAASKLTDRSRMVVISSAAARIAAGDLEITESGASLQLSLGGPLAALHARAARHVLDTVGPEAWSTDAARRALAALVSLKGDTMYSGARRCDSDVRRFISRALASPTPPACSTLLAQFRSTGYACEQHRFRRLYLEVARHG